MRGRVEIKRGQGGGILRSLLGECNESKRKGWLKGSTEIYGKKGRDCEKERRKCTGSSYKAGRNYGPKRGRIYKTGTVIKRNKM